MKIPKDQEDLLDRGGQPTLRDLIERMEFRPADASISLSGARLILQRATVYTDLQNHLIRRFGRDEAMAVLLRLGFNAGRADAEFVRRSWPNIDIGDAFTAGTRLHMVTGTVRVDTLSNDFDFRKDRFRAEFEWRESVEATEYARRFGRADFPVCWSQLGYASGYASEFFRQTVIYKELQCAAMGHKTCRLEGKTIGGWGDDAFVRFFVENVLPARAEPIRPRRPEPRGNAPASSTAPAGSAIERYLLDLMRAPVEKLVAHGIGGLVAGRAGSGHDLLAGILARQLSPPDRPVVEISGTETAVAQRLSEEAVKAGGVILLQDLESLPRHAQGVLSRLLTSGRAVVGALCIGTNGGPSASLVQAMTTLPMTIPPLSDRCGDLAGLAREIAREQSTRKDIGFTEEALHELASLPWRGELLEFQATIRRAVLMTEPGTTLSVAHLKDAMMVSGPIDGTQSATIWEVACRYFEEGHSLADLNSTIYTEALSRCGGNVSRTADFLGISRAQLDYRLRSSRTKVEH